MDHVLPRRAVCDSCNNYFGLKIEKPVLESSILKFIRAQMKIANKRGRIPTRDFLQDTHLPEFRLMTRFIGKIGIEVLCHSLRDTQTWNDEIVKNPYLDELRDYVRYNRGSVWPMDYRTLYPVNAVFWDGHEHFECLHEFDILVTENQEYFVVVAIFGVEFVLNLGGRSLDGYRKWSQKNGAASFLYVDKQKAHGLLKPDMLDEGTQ